MSIEPQSYPQRLVGSWFLEWDKVVYNLVQVGRSGMKFSPELFMLIGEFIHTIDEKNRISLPAKFRKEMGNDLVITPGLDNCLFLFTKKEWAKISEKLSNFSMLSADNRSFNRFMFGGATEVSVDSIGRMLLPDFLKDRASLKGKAALVGVQNRLEIWNDKAWADYKKRVAGQADQLAEKLGGAGVI